MYGPSEGTTASCCPSDATAPACHCLQRACAGQPKRHGVPLLQRPLRRDSSEADMPLRATQLPQPTTARGGSAPDGPSVGCIRHNAIAARRVWPHPAIAMHQSPSPSATAGVGPAPPYCVSCPARRNFNEASMFLCRLTGAATAPPARAPAWRWACAGRLLQHPAHCNVGEPITFQRHSRDATVPAGPAPGGPSVGSIWLGREPILLLALSMRTTEW
jgi:hypothetical protein